MIIRSRKSNADSTNTRFPFNNRVEKYRQRYIPEVKTPEEWEIAPSPKLRKMVSDYYKEHIQGKSVTNLEKGFTIVLSGQGRQKITKGSAMYPAKAAVVLILLKLIEIAEYSNFGERKQNDPHELMGYLNFKAKCIIDGEVKVIRIACMIYSATRIYYNHEINRCV